MSGRLGKADLPAAANTDLYTVPGGKVATVNVAFCNRTAAAISVRLAARSGAVGNADYLEYDAQVPANGVLERTAIVMGEGETLLAFAASAGVSVRVHGFEEMP